MADTALHLIQAWGDLGLLGLFLLAAAFVFGALVFVPRPALCLLAGLVFGQSVMPMALAAATAGAIVAFLLSRHLLQSRVCKAIERRPQLQAIARAVDAEGWRLVVLLRLSPLPGTVLSYLLGLTGLTVKEYAAGTLIGFTPSVLVFIYLGALGATLLDPQSVSRAHWAFLTVGLITIALAAWLVRRRANAILAKRLSAGRYGA